MVRGDSVPDPSAAHWLGLPVIAVPDSDVGETDRRRRDARVVPIRPDRYIAALGPDPEALRGAAVGRRVPDASGLSSATESPG